MHGTAPLAWLTSCLTNRSQTVRMGSVSSNPSNCSSGVPQGSVVGPILFSLYISPIGQIVSNFGFAHQQYADDSQLNISLKGNNGIDSIACLEVCLDSLRNWLCHNGLCLSPDKSESILFGTRQRLVSSWIPLTPLMRTSRLFAKHVTFILDPFDTCVHSQLTWLPRSLSQWCNRG